jgi:hypothetical protein
MLTSYGIWREAQDSFVAAIVETIAAARKSDIKQRSQQP